MVVVVVTILGLMSIHAPINLKFGGFMKLCKLCRANPATIPDRNKMGRPVKEICSDCHGKRLRVDMKRILALHNQKNAGNV